MAQHKIVILLHDKFEMWRPPSWFVQRLRSEFPQVEVAHPEKASGDLQTLSDAVIMIGWGLTPEQLQAATRLKWIYSITAAVDQYMFPQFVASDALITNAGPVHGRVAAEHAIALVLALARRVPSAVRYQERRKW